MPKQSKSNFWLDLLSQLIDVFYKSSRKRTFHQHVVPDKKGWAVRREGNKRVTAVYKYQDQAIRKAKRIAKKHKADVIIHRSDGTIRDRMGYD
jgi:hypothetical protein